MAFHFGSAAVSLALIAWIPVGMLKWASGMFAVTWWGFEITRRVWPEWNDALQSSFRLIVRSRERHVVTSATWFTTALVLLSLTDDRVLCTVGVAVVGVGDPVAAIVGRRWGRVRLPLSRTLEGSIAFVGSAAVFTWAMLRWLAPELGPTQALLLALAGAVAGAAAEVFSWRLDDNITIPVAAAAAAYLAGALVVV